MKKSIMLSVNIHCIQMMLRGGRKKKKRIPWDTNQRVKSKATNLSTPAESSVCTGFFLLAGDPPALPRHYRPSGWCASVAAALAVISLKVSWKLKTSHLRKINTWKVLESIRKQVHIILAIWYLKTFSWTNDEHKTCYFLISWDLWNLLLTIINIK